MTRLLAIAFAAIFVASPCFGSDPPQPDAGTVFALQALASDVAKHPHAEAEDLYKFLHQGLYGPGHAIADPEAVAENLEREIMGLGPSQVADPRCENLGGEPGLVRVNLRPFVADGYDPEALLAAFVESAAEVRGDPEQMDVAVSLVVQWLQTEGMDDLSAELATLAGTLKAQGYPAIHHSAAYSRWYQPAYRVVAASRASARGWCGPPPKP